MPRTRTKRAKPQRDRKWVKARLADADRDFTGENLSGADLSNLMLNSCDFQRCNLSDVDLSGSSLPRSNDKA